MSKARGILLTRGQPGKGVLRIERRIVAFALAAVLAPFPGCAHGPRNFRSVQSQVPVVRARAVGLARLQPDSTTLPVLVERLSDSDPVVRLAAHEELRGRTGRDFGYVPWAGPEERAGAVSQWRDWVSQGRAGGNRPTRSPVSPSKVLPVGTGTVPAPREVR